jgi:hypothetical protein
MSVAVEVQESKQVVLQGYVHLLNSAGRINANCEEESKAQIFLHSNP